MESGLATDCLERKPAVTLAPCRDYDTPAVENMNMLSLQKINKIHTFLTRMTQILHAFAPLLTLKHVRGTIHRHVKIQITLAMSHGR